MPLQPHSTGPNSTEPALPPFSFGLLTDSRLAHQSPSAAYWPDLSGVQWLMESAIVVFELNSGYKLSKLLSDSSRKVFDWMAGYARPSSLYLVRLGALFVLKSRG